MKILFLGDIIGKPGRDILANRLPELRKERQIDFVIANGENVAGGSGITVSLYRELLSFGIDCLTLGDHVFKQKEIIPILETEKTIVRPGNYPSGAPGRGWTVLETTDGTPIAVVSLIGRTFMKPVDCPLRAAEEILAKIAETEPGLKMIVVDYHAEATSDKQLLGRFLDGRVSAVLGTHTHVATADERIFPGGTAFQCDVGMCGPFNSIIGRRIDRVLEHALTFKPSVFDVARGDTRLNGTLVDVDPESGRAKNIERIETFEEA